MQRVSRNDSLEFAERARKNLSYVEAGCAGGADVHVITQVVVSTLALVVFPWEHALVERLKGLRLANLESDGWPTWNIIKGESDTLDVLINRLRNAIAHGRITFSSDARTLEDVIIELEDGPSKKVVKWKASIGAGKLRDFCFRFTQLMEETLA